MKTDTAGRPLVNDKPALYSFANEKLLNTANFNFLDDDTADKEKNKTSKTQQHLKLLLAAEQELGEIAAREVVFTPPIISQNNTGIIRKNTIYITRTPIVATSRDWPK
ncbi:hypothetical protein [Spirosoma arcticum]